MKSNLHKSLYKLVAVIVVIIVGIGIFLLKQRLSSDFSNGVLTINGVTYEMVKVEAGTFTMVNDVYRPSRYQHVTLTKNYYIGKTEVTQALWKAVMGSNPSKFKGDNKPVSNVSWHDCQIFIFMLNAFTGNKFRLPTEAEWVFAARGGNYSHGYRYSGSDNISDVAWSWYDDNSNHSTYDVATKRPNELGLYDMSGYIWEWCSDWLGEYGNNTQYDPIGPSSGVEHVLCGADQNWSSFRNAAVPHYRTSGFGLRLVLSE